MQSKTEFVTMERIDVRKPLWYLITMIILLALIGCSDNTIAAGENGIRIKSGAWLGQNDEGGYTIQFNIVGANIALLAYTYPCGEKYMSVFPPKPIKTEINNSAFEMKIDQTNLTGKFIDSTHVEGTWEVFTHQVPYLGRQDPYLGTVCPAAKGTWTGSAK